MRKTCFLLMVLCHVYLFAQSQCTVVGWASQNGGVTGGGTATATVVTNYNDLKTAITTASVKIVHISGVITIPSAGRISLQDQSGKTIYGLPGSKLVSNDQTKDGSGILYVKRCSNIIFRNLTFEGPGAYDTDGWDNMTLDNSTNIWIDHCEYQDGMDGNLDIKNMTDYVTVSWCKFTYLKAPRAGGPGGSDDHRFSDLFGSSDGATGDRGHLRVTMEHCWWAQGCKERMPRVRFGKVHMVNNFFNSTVASKCVTAGFEADLLVESNVFENVHNAITTMDNTYTAVTSRNNIFTNTSGDTTNSRTAFTPPYTLTITPAINVKSLVTASAGATLTRPYCDSTTTPVTDTTTTPVTDTTTTPVIDTTTTPPPVTYTLTTTAVPAAGGTITGAGTYAAGTVVTITATTASGYTFTGWTGAISYTSALVTITMDSDKSVTANFQAQNTGDTTTTPSDTTDTTIRIEDDASTSQGLCSYDGAISSNSGAANGKVINLANAAGKGVSWKINVPAAGTYSINWHYVNSSSSNAYTMALIINGVTVNSAQSFPKTSSSTVFANTTATVSLNAGDNTIRLQSIAASATADIDWIEITGKTPVAASCVATMASYMLPGSEMTTSNPPIYPNPTTGTATITVTLQKNEQAVIRVYNTQGSLIDNLGTIRSETGGTQQVRCDLNGKRPGLYYVLVRGDKGFKSGYKLFVE